MIRCRYYRWRLACLVDEETAPHGMLLRHMQACAACRVYCETHHWVSQELLQGAILVTEPSSAELDFQVDSQDRSTQKRGRVVRLGRGLRNGAIAAGLLALAYLGASRYLHKDPHRAPAETLMGAVAIPSELATNWMATSATWIESPYTREVELLTSDAGRAVRFLAKCTVNPLNLTPDTAGSTAATRSN